MYCHNCEKNAAFVDDHKLIVVCPDCGHSENFVIFLKKSFPIGISFVQIDSNGIKAQVLGSEKCMVLRFDQIFNPMRLRAETADPHYFAEFVREIRRAFGIYLGTAQIHLNGIMPTTNMTCPMCGRNQEDFKQSSRRPEVLYCPCSEYILRFEYLVASSVAAKGYKVEVSRLKEIKCLKEKRIKRFWPLPDKITFVPVLEMECLFGRAEMLLVVIRPDSADADFLSIVSEIQSILIPRIRMVGVCV